MFCGAEHGGFGELTQMSRRLKTADNTFQHAKLPCRSSLVCSLGHFMVWSLMALGLAWPSGRNLSNTRAWSEPYLNYTYLRKAWESAGRASLHRYSGVGWNQAAGKWEIDEQWPDRDVVAQEAYNVEGVTRPAVNMGFVCHDVRLLDELAQFYIVYVNRFTTLGELRRQGKSAGLDTGPLDGRGEDSARILTWIDKQPTGSRIRDCPLCNGQFLHPASRLIRVITLLPESERTPAMKNFAALYAPLIVHDHLIRVLYETEFSDHYGAKELPRQQVEAWKAIAAYSSRPKLSHQYAMLDTDLWLIATAAEILGANANDPKLVSLTQDVKAHLREIVQTGVNLFQKKRTLYPETKNFRGELVGSASYFNGDFYDHPDYAYSAYTGSAPPTPADKKALRGASWDIGHFYRVPVFMRSLYDNKNATGVDFPTDHDVQLLTNQYMYRVFRGDLAHPLFNNYFDGSNGWYRVGYHGPAFGVPPAQDCDAHSSNRPCATTGAVQGWGELASFNPDLMELEHALATLAWREDPETNRFKDRYYWYNNQSYSFRDLRSRTQYPFLLFAVLAEVPEKLQGCGTQGAQ
jgi:hypothetical protein